jgi:hypothetical protein
VLLQDRYVTKKPPLVSFNGGVALQDTIKRRNRGIEDAAWRGNVSDATINSKTRGLAV